MPIMSTYKELLKQREELEQQIQQARKNELAEAVAKVRSLGYRQACLVKGLITVQ